MRDDTDRVPGGNATIGISVGTRHPRGVVRTRCEEKRRYIEEVCGADAAIAIDVATAGRLRVAGACGDGQHAEDYGNY